VRRIARRTALCRRKVNSVLVEQFDIWGDERVVLGVGHMRGPHNVLTEGTRTRPVVVRRIARRTALCYWGRHHQYGTTRTVSTLRPRAKPCSCLTG